MAVVMRLVTAIHLLAHVVKAVTPDSIDEMPDMLVSNLFSRMLTASPIYQKHVDSTMLGKPGHLSNAALPGPRLLPPVLMRGRIVAGATAPAAVANRPAVVHAPGLEDPHRQAFVHHLEFQLAQSARATEEAQSKAGAPAQTALSSMVQDVSPAQENSLKTSPQVEYGKVTQVHSEEDFDSCFRQSSGLVVLEVTASWCRACRAFARKYERLAEDYGQVAFLKVVGNENSSTHHLVMERLKVKGIPAFFFFRNGEVVHTQRGGKDAELRQLLNELMQPETGRKKSAKEQQHARLEELLHSPHLALGEHDHDY